MQHMYEKLFFKYAKEGNLKGIRECLTMGIYINIRNEYNATPLYIASQHRQYHIVEYLIKAGADPYLVTDSGRNILDIVYLYEYYDIIYLLSCYGIGTSGTELSENSPIVIYETPQENKPIDTSPFVYIRNLFDSTKTTILRKIHSRIKYMFS